MKIWCEKCGGTGGLFSHCDDCQGKGYTENAELMEVWECHQIEKQLLNHEDIDNENININACLSCGYRVTVTSYCMLERFEEHFDGSTKLEALRKAKAWIEGESK